MSLVSTILRTNRRLAIKSPTLLGSCSTISSQQSSSFFTCAPPKKSNKHEMVMPNEKTTNKINKNFLSYHSNNPSMQPTQQRYYPQYTVFHSGCALTFKSIMPEFKKSGPSGNINVARKGRFLLEFSPRHSTNKKEDNAFYGASEGSTFITEWSQSISVALNTEEIGQLLCDLNNGRECKIYHNSNPDSLLKTFQAIPSLVEDGSYKFVLTIGEGSVAEGDEIELNFGEMEVIKVLLENSVPYLTGWMTLMQRSIDSSLVSNS